MAEEESFGTRATTTTSSKVCLIVTGASRGLGRAITEAFCNEMRISSVVLVARSDIQYHVQCDNVHCVQADLGDLDQLHGHVDKILEKLQQQSSYDRIVFINNAGSLGHIGKSIETPNLASLLQTVNFNVTSCLWLSIRIAQFAQQTKAHIIIVNISSLVAVQPFPTLGVYSAGKAARDAYHKCMSLEGIRTLNYAPGPLETDMTEEIRASAMLDESLKPAYAKQLVDPMDSAKKLVGLVAANSFESGQHIDYYDL